jgi:hypothetical protein
MRPVDGRCRVSATETTYAEPLVARVLGPKKAVLVGVRHVMLKKGRDWRLVDGVVHYTAAGLSAMCRHLKLDEQLVVDAAKNSPSGAGSPANDPTAAAPAGARQEASAAAGVASSSISSGQKEGPVNEHPLNQSPPDRNPAGQPFRTASMMTSAELDERRQFARRDPAATIAAAVTARVSSEPVYVDVTGCSPNPLIVFGTVDGVPVRVRVRNNSTFTRGLVLRAKQSAGDPTVYLMIGNPPRWKGDRYGFTRPTSTPETSP